MKKLAISLVAVSLLCSGSYLFAQPQVTLTTKPVPLVRQGTYWVAPADETARYYSYTDNGTDFVCTTTVPTELAGTTYATVNIRRGTAPMEVRCYNSTYFVAP